VSRRLRAATPVIIVCALAIAGFIVVPIDGGNPDGKSSAVQEASPATAKSLSASEYRLRATGICAEYRRESKRIGEAEPNRVVLGSQFQLETRIRDTLKSLQPPRLLAGGHRRVLALWGRRLSIMGYYYDRSAQEHGDRAFIREFAQQVGRVNELARQIDRTFHALDLSPECGLLS
jgi:hypothetical protein